MIALHKTDLTSLQEGREGTHILITIHCSEAQAWIYDSKSWWKSRVPGIISAAAAAEPMLAVVCEAPWSSPTTISHGTLEGGYQTVSDRFICVLII